jgi:hypothetical protein
MDHIGHTLKQANERISSEREKWLQQVGDVAAGKIEGWQYFSGERTRATV